jgi:hypothetical protein
MFSVLQELARLHPREFQTKPGIGQWLDGTAWSAARLAELDIEAEARRAAPAAAAFMADIGPDLVYP